MFDRPLPTFDPAAHDPDDRFAAPGAPALDPDRPRATAAAAADPGATVPVPMQPRRRRRCWTPERRRRFLQALADSGSVSAACEAVGLSRESAYRLRRQPDERAFAAAWDAARKAGVRARSRFDPDGGIWRRPSDARAMYILRRHDPRLYGAPCAAPVESARRSDPVAPPRRLPGLLRRLLRRG